MAAINFEEILYEQQLQQQLQGSENNQLPSESMKTLSPSDGGNNGGNSDPIPLVPANDPSIDADMQQWEQAMEMLWSAEAQIKQLAAMIGTMQNPMLGVMELMNDVQNMSGATISAQAATMNIASDLSNQISSAQNAMNGAENINPGPEDEPTQQQIDEGTQYAKQLVDILNQMQQFLDFQSGSNNSVISGPANDNMQQAINSIKSAFGADWGKPQDMAVNEIFGWNWEADTNGQSSPQTANIQNAMQTLTQSATGMSTAANTQMNFLSQEFNQYLGIEQDAITSATQLTSTEVQNQQGM